jgi:hypothetical protein
MDVSTQKAVRQIGLRWRDRVRRKVRRQEETKREAEGEAKDGTAKDELEEVDEVEFPLSFADGRRVGHVAACFIQLNLH